jgi:hypothetical protein
VGGDAAEPAAPHCPRPPISCRPTRGTTSSRSATSCCADAAVDLISHRNEAFAAEILAKAKPVRELRGIHFIRPELLLVTQLVRPGTKAAIATIELTRARRAAGSFELMYVEHRAAQVGSTGALWHMFARADELERDT